MSASQSSDAGVEETVTKTIKDMNLADQAATDNNNNNNNDNSTEKDDEVIYLSPDDPNYNENKTVLADPENFSIKHPLQNRWSLWFDHPGKKTSQTTWGDQLKKVVTFDTVEDFWRIFNNIRPASKLGSGSNYHLFKEHIEPKWEHAANVKGGKWIVNVKGREQNLDKQWLWSVLACIGESFEEDDEEVCGCVVSVRKTQDRLALWTKTALNDQVQKRIGAKFKRLLELPDNAVIGYQCHADSLKRNSSFNNRNRYEV